MDERIEGLDHRHASPMEVEGKLVSCLTTRTNEAQHRTESDVVARRRIEPAAPQSRAALLAQLAMPQPAAAAERGHLPDHRDASNGGASIASLKRPREMKEVSRPHAEGAFIGKGGMQPCLAVDSRLASASGHGPAHRPHQSFGDAASSRSAARACSRSTGRTASPGGGLSGVQRAHRQSSMDALARLVGRAPPPPQPPRRGSWR